VPATEEPVGGAEATPPPAAKAAPAKKKNVEVLPWANKPLEPLAAAPTEDPAASQAAAAQCVALFEAACRDLKTCAWIADVALQDGTQVPARCVARPPAPPKNAAKKTAPPKKTVKAPEDASEAAPAVKASVTRVEDEAPPPKAEKKKLEPEAQDKAQEKAKAFEPAAVEPVAKVESEPAESKPPQEAQANKAPIVVKPPPPAPSSGMPSFGSISPIMPGGSDAVVVTVPPSQ
jgi:hypothetical protein